MASHPVDKHVGNRLKNKRLLVGMSQDELGKAVGVTFQQIQKYEKGLNRIGCSRLHEIAMALITPISFFFEGLEGQDNHILSNNKYSAMNESAHDDYDAGYADKASSKEVLSLVRSYSLIKNASVRKNLLSLIKSMANCDSES